MEAPTIEVRGHAASLLKNTVEEYGVDVESVILALYLCIDTQGTLFETMLDVLRDIEKYYAGAVFDAHDYQRMRENLVTLVGMLSRIGGNT